MRKEQVDYDWRIVLGDEAKALVLDVLPEGQRPASKDLEAGIQRLRRDTALAQGQAEGAKAVATEIAMRLETAMARITEDQKLALIVLSKAYREMFVLRQAPRRLRPEGSSRGRCGG